VRALEERIHDDGGADVRNDQKQLQERSEEDPVVGAAVRDVADRIVQNRLEEEKRRDRRDERDEVKGAEGERYSSVFRNVGLLSATARTAARPYKSPARRFN
jgi:hypothetical protein